MATGRARHVFHAIVLVVGVVALVLLLDQLGWDGLREALVNAGPWFGVIAAIELCALLADAAAIYCFVRPQAPVRFWRVFVAQSSGLAINRLTPGNSAGEPVKATMLVEHLPASVAVSGIVMFNLATLTIGVATVLIGVPLTLVVIDLPVQLEIVVWIATATLVAVAVGLVTLARRGALGAVIDGLQRMRILSLARAARWRDKVTAIDDRLRTFGKPGTRTGIAWALVSRLLYLIGTVVVMIAAGVPMTAPLVIANLSVGILITWLSNLIPLGLGVADGSNYALYAVLGSTGPVGLAFTMINRARTCLLAGMGLTVMAIASVADRRRGRRAQQLAAAT